MIMYNEADIFGTKMPAIRLEIIAGCMFAGKTSELVRRAKRLQSVGDTVLMINHTFDTRTCQSVKTHDGVRVSALKVNSLMKVIDTKEFREADAICIDEGQFFTDIGKFIEAIESEDKTIVIAALDGDRNRKPFRNITDLIPMCESFVKISALERLPNGNTVEANYSMLLCEDSGSNIIIGSSEKYKAVSRETYLNTHKK